MNTNYLYLLIFAALIAETDIEVNLSSIIVSYNAYVSVLLGIAATKAILEHGHVGPYIRRQMLDPDRQIPAKADEVRTLLDHALFYAPPERAEAARFLIEGEPVSLAELPRPDGGRLEICRGALAAAGVRVAVADVTAPDVVLSPFRVARALGVHVQPIHFGHGLERRANPRLRALADRANEMPHPLA